MPETLKEYFSRMGRKGGKASRRRLTPAERKESARRAALARWAREKKKQEPK